MVMKAIKVHALMTQPKAVEAWPEWFISKFTYLGQDGRTLAQFEIIKTDLIQPQRGANYPSPGCNPGYPENKNTKP